MSSCHPLQLWGTYLGLFLGLLISFLSLGAYALFAEFPPLSYLILLLPPLAGFLLGWALHCLLRRLRK